MRAISLMLAAEIVVVALPSRADGLPPLPPPPQPSQSCLMTALQLGY